MRNVDILFVWLSQVGCKASDVEPFSQEASGHGFAVEAARHADPYFMAFELIDSHGPDHSADRLGSRLPVDLPAIRWGIIKTPTQGVGR